MHEGVFEICPSCTFVAFVVYQIRDTIDPRRSIVNPIAALLY